MLSVDDASIKRVCETRVALIGFSIRVPPGFGTFLDRPSAASPRPSPAPTWLREPAPLRILHQMTAFSHLAALPSAFARPLPGQNVKMEKSSTMARESPIPLGTDTNLSPMASP